MTKLEIMEKVQGFVSGWGLGMSKEAMVDKVYRFMEREHDVCCLNGKYIIIDGNEFQFIKSRKDYCWYVKEL